VDGLDLSSPDRPAGPSGATTTDLGPDTGTDPESSVERTLSALATLNPTSGSITAADVAAGVAGRHDGSEHADDPAGSRPADGRPAAMTIDDLYRSHRMGMVRLAILLVDDQASAEDVVQEAFAGLFRHWDGLRDTAAAIGYLRTAVVNGSRSMLRRRRTARAYVPPDAGTARSAESLAMLSAEHRTVVSALAELAPRQREVLVLRYYGGLSEAEIAEATGLSKGTVKSTASRAVARLGDLVRERSS
jgi:RNA polymerase sigma-70 factor (sigma-E family)